MPAPIVDTSSQLYVLTRGDRRAVVVLGLSGESIYWL